MHERKYKLNRARKTQAIRYPGWDKNREDEKKKASEGEPVATLGERKPQVGVEKRGKEESENSRREQASGALYHHDRGADTWRRILTWV